MTTLYYYSVFKTDDVNYSARFVTNLDIVAKIDPAAVSNARLDHCPSFPESVTSRSSQIWQIEAFVIDCIHVIMKVEKELRHDANNGFERRELRALTCVRG